MALTYFAIICKSRKQQKSLREREREHHLRSRLAALGVRSSGKLLEHDEDLAFSSRRSETVMNKMKVYDQ